MCFSLLYSEQARLDGEILQASVHKSLRLGRTRARGQNMKMMERKEVEQIAMSVSCQFDPNHSETRKLTLKQDVDKLYKEILQDFPCR